MKESPLTRSNEDNVKCRGMIYAEAQPATHNLVGSRIISVGAELGNRVDLVVDRKISPIEELESGS